MNSITQTIETNLISFANSLYLMSAEVTDIDQYYFGSSASTLVGALASGTDPATTQAFGALNKGQLIDGITLCEQLKNFFGNSAVSASGYLGTADTLINGFSPKASALSPDVENIGQRLKALGQNLIQLNKDAANMEKAYNSSGLSAVMGSIGASTVVYGCNLTQSKFIGGIILLQQFQKFLTNQAVSTGDYLSTVTNLVMGA